jgi:hypothetical protein
MKSAKLIVELTSLQSKVNVVVQSVKGNNFAGGIKTAVVTAGTDAINYIGGMINALNSFEDIGNQDVSEYDDTATINANVTIIKGLEPDNALSPVINKTTQIIGEVIAFINKEDDENIVSADNRIFQRDEQYVVSKEGALASLQDIVANILD